MPRGKRGAVRDKQQSLLDVTSKLRTAACVPALREAAKAWRADGYKGTTATTSLLLNYWFSNDHRLPSGRPFVWHASQREAIETLIFVWEAEKIRTRRELLERYAESLKDIPLAAYDEFAR